MKNLFIILSIMFVFTSCVDMKQSSEAKASHKQEQLMLEAESQIGMPAITNFQEKKIAKMIFELRDRSDLVCYAYIVNHMTGNLVFIGKCIGYGLPYSTQYTNPEKLVDRYGRSIDNHNYDAYNLPQADPNGLFMPQGLSATWLMMINPKTNEPTPIYVEPELIVSPFPLN